MSSFFLTRREAARYAAAACGLTMRASAAGSAVPGGVRLLRTPAARIQPQLARDSDGALHMVCYSGDPHAGDIFYAHSADGGASWSPALRVNSTAGTAIAAGTIRGAQIALGRGRIVHVAWNGSDNAPKGTLNPDSGKAGAPMLYARLRPGAASFEPERNLMNRSFGLDGGGTVAAGRDGTVYVMWHGIGLAEAKAGGLEGEGRRQVWLARSRDDGSSFEPERKAWTRPLGACGCCAMKSFVDEKGNVFALYRSATENVHRDIWLLRSNGGDSPFEGRLLHRWNIGACPMTSMDIVSNGSVVLGAWETAGQVCWTRLSGPAGEFPLIEAPGERRLRKHPRLAIAGNGTVLMAWTEGAGYQKGGTLAWQIFDAAGRALTAGKGGEPTPAMSFPAVSPAGPGGFSLLV